MFDFLRYEYAAARLRAMKGRLIDKSKFSKLVNAKSVSEIANILEKTEYGPVFYHGMEKDAESIENDLDVLFVKTLEKIRGFYPEDGKNMVDIFLKEWEVKNLKLLAKSVFSEEDWKGFIVPVVGFDTEEVLKTSGIEGVKNKLKGTVYFEALSEAQKKFERFGPQAIDFYLDIAYSKICIKIIEGLKDKEMFLSYVKWRNDLINLRNIMRSIIFKGELRDFFIEPTSIPKEWFGLQSTEALFEKLKSKKIFVSDIKNLEDDLIFETASGRYLEGMVLKFLHSSPFDEGLLLYYVVMKRDEVNKLKVITRFVKENLDRKDLKILLGMME